MKTFFIIILIILINGCVTEEPLNNSFKTINPQNIGDGHTLTTPSAENMDSLRLVDIYNNVYSEENLWSLRSLLVFRNGRLVSESYLKDANDITTPHLIWSCTKQVMGVLTGIAIEKGVIESIDDPISKYLEEELAEHEDKREITLRNLITMQSGINYSNDGLGGETDLLLRQIPDNSIEFVLDRSINYTPGTTFDYNDGNPHLMSAIIQNATGKPTDVWADEVLFSKIEMSNYSWERYKDGITFGGFGIITTPRELAKIALCVADDGVWKNQQIIPFSWIEEMTSEQIEASEDYSFGYYWWIDKTRDIHFMWGHGGQFAFIIPSKNLVVVMTSIPNTQGDYQIQADEALEVVDKIIKICN